MTVDQLLAPRDRKSARQADSSGERSRVAKQFPSADERRACSEKEVRCASEAIRRGEVAAELDRISELFSDSAKLADSDETLRGFMFIYPKLIENCGQSLGRPFATLDRDLQGLRLLRKAISYRERRLVARDSLHVDGPKFLTALRVSVRWFDEALQDAEIRGHLRKTIFQLLRDIAVTHDDELKRAVAKA